MKPSLRRAMLVALAVYLGAWTHEALHSAQSAATGHDGLTVPVVVPFTFLAGCTAVGPHGVPTLGCTDDWLCGEDANCEILPYAGQVVATAADAWILLAIRRPAKARLPDPDLWLSTLLVALPLVGRVAPCRCAYVVHAGEVLAYRDCRAHGGAQHRWPPAAWASIVAAVPA